MHKISEIASNIASEVTKKDGKKTKFDPMIIVAIIGVIFDLVKMWQDCSKYQATPKTGFFKGRWFFRERTERHVFRALQLKGLDVMLTQPITESIFELVRNKNDEQLLVLVKECEDELPPK